MAVSPRELAGFRAFVDRAAELNTTPAVHPGRAPFEAFLAEARELALVAIRRQASQLLEFSRIWPSWRAPHDLLAVAGLSYVENAYTELLAWALGPGVHPASALARQRGFVERLWPNALEGVGDPVQPLTQLRTSDGIPDLVLKYPGLAVVVEAKTGCEEHETPEGELQTVAYEGAIRGRLGLPEGFPVLTAYLTPDGRAPASPKAKACTYLGVTVSLMKALEGVDLPPGDRSAFATVFTHFVRNATPLGREVEGAIARVASQLESTGGHGGCPVSRDVVPVWHLSTCLGGRN